MELFFPPQQPGLAGETFRGFHYFYDFLLSRFGLMYGFTAEDLNFRLFPLLISVLYGLAFYFFGSFMTKDIIKIRWIILFAYFSQSSIFILQFLKPELPWEQAPVVQPIGLLVNPFMVFAIGILLLGLALIPQIEKNWKYSIIVGLLLGILSQIKVYAGLAGIFCVVSYPLYRFIVKKSFIAWKGYALAILLTGFLTAVTFLPNNYKAGGLVFMPFIFYREFMQRSLFNNNHWEIKRTIFAEHNNYIRIAILYIQAFAIFWLLNIGTRIVLFSRAGQMLKKEFWQNGYHIILLLAITFLLLIASLFIQTVSVFDTVQFFWVMIPLLCIPSGIVVGHLWMTHRRFVKIILLVTFVVASYWGFISIILDYFPGKPATIPSQDLAVYKTVSELVPIDKFVVYLPSETSLNPNKEFLHTGTLLVAAMTGRSVYFEPGGVPSKSNDVYNTRRKELFELHLALEKCDDSKIIKSLSQIGGDHILTSNYYSCLATSSAVFKTASSNQLFFYQRK